MIKVPCCVPGVVLTWFYFGSARVARAFFYRPQSTGSHGTSQVAKMGALLRQSSDYSAPPSLQVHILFLGMIYFQKPCGRLLLTRT
jgi:hypothetical protein